MPRLRVSDTPLATKVLAELATFGEWCRRGGVNGFIGEVGWPNDQGGHTGIPDNAVAWNDVADLWFGMAEHYGFHVNVWGCDEAIPAFTNGPYRSTAHVTPPTTPLSIANTQTAVMNTHKPAGKIRSVQLIGLSNPHPDPNGNPTSTFSNLNPGVLNTDYWIPRADSMDYLAAQGVMTLRIDFAWERVQPTLLGALDSTYLGYIQAVTAHAAANGQQCILDMHNFGSYYQDVAGTGTRYSLGDGNIGNAEFADLWSRMATVFKNDAGVWGYDLMNEPWGDGTAPGSVSPTTWESASQAAVTAIRATSDTKNILVEGSGFSALPTWVAYHPRPWITDSAGKTFYSPHHYFDGSGNYGDATPTPQDYAWCLARAVSLGYS